MRKKEDFENLLFAIKLTESERELPFFKNFMEFRGNPKLPADTVNLYRYLSFLEMAVERWRKHVKQEGSLAFNFNAFVNFKWPPLEEESDDEVAEDED